MREFMSVTVNWVKSHSWGNGHWEQEKHAAVISINSHGIKLLCIDAHSPCHMLCSASVRLASLCTETQWVQRLVASYNAEGKQPLGAQPCKGLYPLRFREHHIRGNRKLCGGDGGCKVLSSGSDADFAKKTFTAAAIHTAAQSWACKQSWDGSPRCYGLSGYGWVPRKGKPFSVVCVHCWVYQVLEEHSVPFVIEWPPLSSVITNQEQRTWKWARAL